MNECETKDTKQKPRRTQALTKEELENFSKEELISKILQLQAHNTQLKNLIAKRNTNPESTQIKEADSFKESAKIHIFLRILYLGWDYQGFTSQEDTNQTIEHHLFNALVLCRLIRNRETSNYNRCGRTDKGVSSFGQVISITVRASQTDKPLNYCQMLNRLLPRDIRVIAWRPVAEGMSARFNCTARTYRYFFPKANLDIQAMREAASQLLGCHDFRNLCKMDVGNGVTNFVRSTEQVSIEPFYSTHSDNDSYEIYAFELTGKAFLWHQVRCIMSILMLVGQNLEAPDVVSRLLDVEKNPRKPQYPLVSPIPLNLFKCSFDAESWQIDETETRVLVEHLQKLWTEQIIKATQIKCMIEEIRKLLKVPVYGQCSGLLRKESKVYKSLFDRQLCSSLEDRIEHYSKKQRLQ